MIECSITAVTWRRHGNANACERMDQMGDSSSMRKLRVFARSRDVAAQNSGFRRRYQLLLMASFDRSRGVTLGDDTMTVISRPAPVIGGLPWRNASS